ncbi:hypothetical protein K461DRAFT_212157, partial [Myriangium duriaei CBS 260.36]
MDVAYDHIQEETLPADEEADPNKKPSGGLNEEFQEAFKAVSSSPWGARLGGFFGQLKTQGESLYTEAQKEYTAASSSATKGLTDLRSTLAQRARGLSIQQPESSDTAASFSDPNFVLPESPTKTHHDKGKGPAGEEAAAKPDSLPADIVKEATSMVSRFRTEAASRLVAVRKAEDAADEALLRFGTNVRNFLREAVTVSAPPESGEKTEVLFETNDAEGRRVFHSSRMEAQLHAIHTRQEGLMKDPGGEEWEKWRETFDVEKETARIAGDLEKYEELRRAMERLVPEKVEYKDFWSRYYYLRMVVEEEEKRRKEVLKGAAADNDEEVGWGDDDEDDESSTPIGGAATAGSEPAKEDASASQSTTTLTPPKKEETTTETVEAPRRSHEEDKKSNSADSDASYDLVSGATSKAPGTP